MAALRKLSLLATAALGFVITPAQAAVDVTGYTYTPGELSGGLNIGSISESGAAGRFLTTIRDLDTLVEIQRYTFCLDAANGFYTYSPYDDVMLSSLVGDSTRQGLLAGLLVHANADIDSSLNPSLTAAAYALAIWEVFYDTGSAPYSLSNGDGYFSVFGDLNAAGGLAETLLSNNWTASASLVRGLKTIDTNVTSQNQIYLQNSNAVPEPATWLTMILGMGLIGAAMRRNKRQTTSATITFA